MYPYEAHGAAIVIFLTSTRKYEFDMEFKRDVILPPFQIICLFGFLDTNILLCKSQNNL